MGDERARKREIQPSPKAISGRAWRRGPNVQAPYLGRPPGRESRRSQQRPQQPQGGVRVLGIPTVQDRLIGNYLRAPMQQPDGRRQKRQKGTPQGGPLLPLLANIHLDELDLAPNENMPPSFSICDLCG
jgi:hypothetical protein